MIVNLKHGIIPPNKSPSEEDYIQNTIKQINDFVSNEGYVDFEIKEIDCFNGSIKILCGWTIDLKEFTKLEITISDVCYFDGQIIMRYNYQTEEDNQAQTNSIDQFISTYDKLQFCKEHNIKAPEDYFDENDVVFKIACFENEHIYIAGKKIEAVVVNNTK